MRAPWGTPVSSDTAKLRRVLAGTRLASPAWWELFPKSKITDDFPNLNAWSVVDSGGNISVADGVVSFNGSGVWLQNGIYRTLAATKVLPAIIEFKVKMMLLGGGAEVLFLFQHVGLSAFMNSVTVVRNGCSIDPFSTRFGSKVIVRGPGDSTPTTTIGVQPFTDGDWLTIRLYMLAGGPGGFGAAVDRVIVTIQDQHYFSEETVLTDLTGSAGSYGLWYTDTRIQFNRYTDDGSNPHQIKQFRYYEEYPTDGPYLRRVADAGKEFTVSDAGTLAASDLQTLTGGGVVTFTGGATGVIRSFDSVTGKANIHTISGAPQAGTVTCSPSGHTFTISDTGAQCYFDRFDLSRFEALDGWATTNAAFRYAVDGGALSGYKTLAELLAIGNLGKCYRVIFDAQANSDGATQQYIGELNAEDCVGTIGPDSGAGAVYPAENKVARSEEYGPNGDDYTGNLQHPIGLVALAACNVSEEEQGAFDIGATAYFVGGIQTAKLDMTGALVSLVVYDLSTWDPVDGGTLLDEVSVDFVGGATKTLKTINGGATWPSLVISAVGQYAVVLTVAHADLPGGQLSWMYGFDGHDLPALENVHKSDTLQGVTGTLKTPITMLWMYPYDLEWNGISYGAPGETIYIDGKFKFSKALDNAKIEIFLRDQGAVQIAKPINVFFSFDADTQYWMNEINEEVEVELTLPETPGEYYLEMWVTHADLPQSPFIVLCAIAVMDLPEVANVAPPDTVQGVEGTHECTGGEVPAFQPPGLAVVDNGDGSVSCAVTGNLLEGGGDQTSRLKYRRASDSDWTVHSPSFTANGDFSGPSGLAYDVVWKFQLVPYDAATGAEGPASDVVPLMIRDASAVATTGELSATFDLGTDALFAAHGRNVVLTPYGLSPVAALAIVALEDTPFMDEEASGRQVWRAKAEIRSSVRPVPDRRDLVAIDGLTYTVTNQPRAVHGRVVYELERTVTVRRSGPGTVRA